MSSSDESYGTYDRFDIDHRFHFIGQGDDPGHYRGFRVERSPLFTPGSKTRWKATEESPPEGQDALILHAGDLLELYSAIDELPLRGSRRWNRSSAEVYDPKAHDPRFGE